MRKIRQFQVLFSVVFLMVMFPGQNILSVIEVEEVPRSL
jgi:hypothetical protein